MPTTYHPGDTSTIYLQVLRLSGSVPNFPGDYTAPQLRIVHAKNGVLAEDVPFTPMTQLDDNLWFHPYAIPANPFLGNYLVEFRTAIDGVDVESADEFRVEQSEIIEEGQGSCEVSGTVRDEGTLQPISGVTVLVFHPNDLANALAKDVTDGSGTWRVFLNPGTYRLRFHRVGFIDETHTLTVNPDCTRVIEGN